MIKNITLTQDQKAAVKAFCLFLLDPKEKYMVIHGAAGTGKSTLITHLMEALEKQYKMYALLLCKQPTEGQFEALLTATTNKAVAVLEDLTERKAQTVNALLQVRVAPNFKTGKQELVKNKNYCLLYNKLIILDEASMLNDELFELLDQTTVDCKIVLIGDQYQLAPVKQKKSLMETLNCPKILMNKVMRHGDEILAASTLFRDTVEYGNFPEIPNGQNIVHVKGSEFKRQIDQAFLSPSYRESNTKILAWTNDRVIEYNRYVRDLKGYPTQFHKGETVITNNFIAFGKYRWAVDSPLEITQISSPIERKGVTGRLVVIDGIVEAFLPNDPRDIRATLKHLKKMKEWREYYTVQETWLDLRPAYASTVHKAQGSTYKKVFIDLSDIGRCTIASDVARMLYVAISRASEKVILFGSLPQRYQPQQVAAAVQ